MLLPYALPVLACLAQAAEAKGKAGISGSKQWSTSLRVDHPKCRPTSLRLAVFSDPERCESGEKPSVQVIVEDDTAVLPLPGYKPAKGFGFYKLHTKTATWYDAKRICEKEGAHLAVINSEAEALYLTSLIWSSKIPGDWIFVGFHDLNQEGKFETIFGETLEEAGFSKWHTGQPDNSGNNEHCGTILRNAQLSDYPCTHKCEFFCEQEHTSAYLMGSPPHPPPPSGGYELVHGLGNYKLHLERKPWPEAKAACEAEGAHLLILNSQAEEAAIKAIVDRHPKAENWFLVGFHDPNKTRNFVTIFGDPLASTGYTRWQEGKPDNVGNNEYCGSIHRSLGLNDLSCTWRGPFFCEFEI